MRRSRSAIVVGLVVRSMGAAAAATTAAVAEVEVDFVVVVLILLAAVHVGIVARIAVGGLMVIAVILLLVGSRLRGGRCWGRLGLGSWRWCRLRRCLVVVAVYLSALGR